MPKYLIERNIPHIGNMTADELMQASRRSNDALQKLGGSVQWLESFVTDDKLTCVYVAPGEELVRRHAELSGFPANKISEVRAVIDPVTGEPKAGRKAA